ncbi:hypothetical protein E2553_18885 [Paraburkholderia dipogonis]|uniref:Uncharacterized protein n=1 Tax=Paraburkholderia dipogonis TaxID=1211383 RepID=A0A4Y8NB82_9BURK|nr:hypothetical protein [Paraburkholderia dipogonis]TFE46921.1 hypothetical protein E2553_18885 [Paraburkholderia dipogonis]
MPSSTVSALILQLQDRYKAASPMATPVLATLVVPERDVVPSRRRWRGSALEPYRSIAEQFIKRRAHAHDRTAYTYARLARLVERKSGRRFAVSTLQRRMVVWGIVDGMERYQE